MRKLAILSVAWGISLSVWAGCSDTPSLRPTVGASDGGTKSNACPPCTTDQDCNGGTCAQLGGDSYCAAPCPNGDECASDRACTAVSSVTGQQVSVCVPRSDVCSATSEQDAGAAPNPTGKCGGLDGPSVKSTCTSCTGKSNCQPNGCYGQWWCNAATKKCQAPPTNCGGSNEPFDAGAPLTGTVTASGGSLSRLLFAVAGDTRPATIDDTGGYPSPIITKIFSGIQALTPRPAFVVSTGDYMFASTSHTEADPQLDLYLGARGKFSGVLFPAMGNHECTGATASNCGPGAKNGATSNYTSFLTKMLGPIQQTNPYYAIHIDALDKSWTAKFVFIAANAWTTDQESWLTTTLSENTTYTFIVRHESHSATTAPGVTPSEQIMAQHPYTLAIVGHTHTYEHWDREVIVGNGGAPLTGSKNYGFAIVNQRADGAIQVDMIDYESGATDAAFRFALRPDGSPAP